MTFEDWVEKLNNKNKKTEDKILSSQEKNDGGKIKPQPKATRV